MGSFEKEPKTEQTTKINGYIIVFFLIITWLILLTVRCVCEDNDSADRDRCGPLSYDFIICNILRESLSNRDSIEIATVSGLSVRCRRRWHEGVKVTSWATSQFIQPISSRADASSCFFLRHTLRLQYYSRPLGGGKSHNTGEYWKGLALKSRSPEGVE